MSCTLVSRRWRQIALPYLFRDVQFTVYRYNHTICQSSLQDFVDFLAEATAIRRCIYVLDLRQDDIWAEDYSAFSSEDPPLDLDGFAQLDVLAKPGRLAVEKCCAQDSLFPTLSTGGHG